MYTIPTDNNENNETKKQCDVEKENEEEINENSKIKKQYNIEKENENEINKDLTRIMKNCASQKDLMDFIRKIREYRTRIYELKMQLKEDLSKAYSMKESKEFIRWDIEKELKLDYETTKRYIIREQYLVSKKKTNGQQYSGPRDTEEDTCEKNVRRICEEINIILATRIFKYYEDEIAFWEEMNLNKIMEVDSKERFFD